MKRIATLACLAIASQGLLGCKSDKPMVAEKSSAMSNKETPKLAASEAASQSVGSPTPKVLFYNLMPTGVAISHTGRIFINFPRWGDPVQYCVAEIVNGKIVPFPNLYINKMSDFDPANRLICVQSVQIDAKDRLWILDPAAINLGKVTPGGPKLICVDLQQNRIVQTIHFDSSVAGEDAYLNDVMFDLNRGAAGMAYITDSSTAGANGIIVVDLSSGKSWRRLSGHAATRADENYTPLVEGSPLMARNPNQPAAYIKIGSDGIAIDTAKKLLYFCPLASHRIYSVDLDALSDEKKSDEDVASTIKELPRRDFGSDGLICDRAGTLYLTDYEHNAIRKFEGEKYEIVASSPQMIWPDSMAIGPDNQIYVTCNQLNRQKNFHDGKDLREEPYVLFNTHVQTAGAQQ